MERLGKEAEETQAVCSLALDSKVREVRERRWLLYLFSVYLLLVPKPTRTLVWLRRTARRGADRKAPSSASSHPALHLLSGVASFQSQ